jgi:hypothetical protein
MCLPDDVFRLKDDDVDDQFVESMITDQGDLIQFSLSRG